MTRTYGQTAFLLGVIVLLVAVPVIVVLRRSPDSWGYLDRATAVTAPSETGSPTNAATDPDGPNDDVSASADADPEGERVHELETRVAQLEAVLAGTPTASSVATPALDVMPGSPTPTARP